MPPTIPLFLAITAITIGLIQTYVPPSETRFVSSTLAAFCLLFGLIVSPIPKRHSNGCSRSIPPSEHDCRGSWAGLNVGRRVKPGWRYFLSTIVTRTTNTNNDDSNNSISSNTEPITQSTLWAQYFRPLLLYTLLYALLHYLLLSLQDYFKYTALHRFHQSVQCDMISNLLRQEEEYLHSIPAVGGGGGGGFTHLMEVECRRLQSIINEFLPRFIYGGNAFWKWNVVVFNRSLMNSFPV
eukprot:CCRYP_012584-RA/>CCRYP_012584-RA protein AED:0.38 eAED:0.44 QI:0/0/0/1/1/1/2/0/238